MRNQRPIIDGANVERAPSRYVRGCGWLSVRNRINAGRSVFIENQEAESCDDKSHHTRCWCGNRNRNYRDPDGGRRSMAAPSPVSRSLPLSEAWGRGHPGRRDPITPTRMIRFISGHHANFARSASGMDGVGAFAVLKTVTDAAHNPLHCGEGDEQSRDGPTDGWISYWPTRIQDWS